MTATKAAPASGDIDFECSAAAVSRDDATAPLGPSAWAELVIVAVKGVVSSLLIKANGKL